MVVPDSGYLVVSRTLMNSNWRIAGIIDRGFLTQSSKDITHIVMLVLLIIAFPPPVCGPCLYPSPYTNQYRFFTA